jgi:predicted alpha/beta hydrolase family esterase
MKKVIALHGICDSEEYHSDEFPSSSNSHWIPWLQKQLLINQIDCQTPDVMNSYKANYEDWLRTIKPHAIDDNTILVGHSAGCGFFLKYLSENRNIQCDKLIMVAPFNDPFKKYNQFLQCDLDENLFARMNEMHLFYSIDEPVLGIKETVDFIQSNFPKCEYLEFKNKGHFCFGNDGNGDFPELLDIVLN